MSSYSAQQQGSYGATGWEWTNTRTPGPARSGQYLPLTVVVAPAVTSLGHTMLLTGPVFA